MPGQSHPIAAIRRPYVPCGAARGTAKAHPRHEPVDKTSQSGTKFTFAGSILELI
jgi:hypothetical protein